MNIYDILNRNLYLITSFEESAGQITMSAKEIQSHNEIFSESLLPGELYGNFSLKDGFLQSSNFVTGSAGWQLTSTSGELNFAVSVDSLDIPDTTTTNSFHIDSDGNMWLGATTFAGSNAKVSNAGAATFNSITITGGSITIGGNASIDSSGNATFKSVTTLNMKVFTSFESSGRFVLTGDVAPTFGNNGMVVAPGTTAHFSRALWWVSNFVFGNLPTFTCAVIPITAIAGDGVGFVGLGLPTITSSGMIETGKNYCGFEFKKTSGVLTVIAVQCDGGGTVTFSGTLRTLAVDDSLELFIKVNDSSIDYYTRLNGSDLSAVTTLSATLPTGAEHYISFVTSNKDSTDDMKLQFQCAAYEH